MVACIYSTKNRKWMDMSDSRNYQRLCFLWVVQVTNTFMIDWYEWIALHVQAQPYPQPIVDRNVLLLNYSIFLKKIYTSTR